MRAICPNDSTHAEFITVATITEDWKVDAEGGFLEVLPGDEQTVHGPCRENTWACFVCGAEAKVS